MIMTTCLGFTKTSYVQSTLTFIIPTDGEAWIHAGQLCLLDTPGTLWRVLELSIFQNSFVKSIAWAVLKIQIPGPCGKGEKFPFPSSGSFGWKNNQISRRKIDKRKSNLIPCVGEPQHMRETETPTCMRGLMMESGLEVCKTSWARDE